MRGYAKVKGNNSFAQRSKVSKEYSFLDVDFDDGLAVYSSKPQENEQKPNIIIDDKKKKNDIFQHEVVKHEGESDVDGVLKRNLTVSSSSTSSSLEYQKNGSKTDNLERQSSSKTIQKAVMRAFSMRRSSSVNSNRYCRIYDQPKNVRDFDYNHNRNRNHIHGDVYDDDGEFECEGIGSMEANYMNLKSNKGDYDNNGSNGKVNVGSKVAKACKRLFSR